MSVHVHWQGRKSSLKSVPQTQWPNEHKVHLSLLWVVLRQIVWFVGISASHSHSDTNFFYHLHGKRWENDMPRTQSATYSYKCILLQYVHACLSSLTVCTLQMGAGRSQSCCDLPRKPSRQTFWAAEVGLWAHWSWHLEWRGACRLHFKIHPTNQHTGSYTFSSNSLSFRVIEDAGSCDLGYTARRLSSTTMKQNTRMWDISSLHGMMYLFCLSASTLIIHRMS